MSLRARAATAIALATLLGACGATGDISYEEDGGAPAPSSVDPEPVEPSSFGTLSGLCGPGEYTVETSEQGIDNAQLNIGVATDRTSEVRPGLNEELWMTSTAYADWCNNQGGIGGLEINLVELSGGLFNVEAAMTTACSDVFAMVGGGFAQDNLEFSGKDASDFHRCDMIDIPGFAASGEKSGSNGMVQPAPNTPDTELNTIFRDFKQLEPAAATSAVIVYGELPTMEINRDKYEAALTDSGIDIAGTVSYPVAGVTDWIPYAQRVIDTGATMLTYVGEPANLAALLSALRQQRWTGTPVLQSNMYDPQLFSQGDEGPEGAIVRMSSHPFEEPDEWPAIKEYIDLMHTHEPGAKLSPLGVNSMSAWLLFTVAANECATTNDQQLGRTCVLEAAAAQTEWTGGGLHAPQTLGPNDEVATSPCAALVVARSGKFERLYPEIGSDNDDIDGFHCPDDGVTTVDDHDIGVIDPTRPL